MKDFEIRPAGPEDAPLLLSFIQELADYELLSHEVVATPEVLRESLFGEKSTTEGVIGYHCGEPVGFALFFHNFSTFLGRPGIYLEDLFVQEKYRGKGFGRALLAHLAKVTRERNCGRLEWAVLDWNKPAIDFYKKLGAIPMEGWTLYRLAGDALDKMN